MEALDTRKYENTYGTFTNNHSQAHRHIVDFNEDTQAKDKPLGPYFIMELLAG